MVWRQIGDRQAIIWNNAEMIHWRIHGALGGDELKVNMVQLVYNDHRFAKILLIHVVISYPGIAVPSNIAVMFEMIYTV